MGDRRFSVLRAWGFLLLAVASWWFCRYASEPHRVAGLDAPAQMFSASRAEKVLATLLGPERPHPVGSAENAAVRARILGEFAKLGVHAQTYRAFACNGWRHMTSIACATVTDVVADAIPGSGKAIVLLAHYDSVPAGPGASDDESSVATILETVRALKAEKAKLAHPVLAVITDGEEAGLLGATAFLQNKAFKSRVGAVINAEARGTRGPSLLFQTSPGDGRLIDLYAKSVPAVATSSLYVEIYKVLPNDTDLTLFIRDGFPSFNFAFAENVRYYHSPFDLRANLDPATLQMQGDNVLGVARGLEKTSFAALKGGNDIYVGMLGVALPRLPESWALPLAIIVFAAIAMAAWLAREDAFDWRHAFTAASMPLLVLVGSAFFGWLLMFVAQMVSGLPDPAYAYPATMRAALGFGVWAMTLLASRLVRADTAAGAAWLWMAVFGVLTALFLPGISPYFLFPGVVAAALLLATARTHWSSGFGQTALFVAALAAFAFWIPIVVSGETVMGLRLHPLFTVPAAFAAIAIVPLLAARPMSKTAWRISAGLSAVVAFILAVIAGFIPAYSAASLQRLNLVYFELGKSPACWIADTSWKGIGTEPIPAQLMKAGPFRLDRDAWAGLIPGDAYTAPANAQLYPLPKAVAVRRNSGSVELAFHGSASANGMIMDIPRSAGLVSLSVRGQTLAMERQSQDIRFLCLTPDCRDLELSLVLRNKQPVTVSYAELRYGLPRIGTRLQAARPATAMPSQSGDETVIANKLQL